MNAERRTHNFTQINNARPEQVFPLLCPVREAEWVPDWKYRLVYSESGFAELGCVFTTPGANGTEITWVVTEFDPAQYRIAFAWVWPQMIATRLTIQLSPDGASTTKASIIYQYTALSETGARELAGYDEAWFKNKMTGWEGAINHYLAKGSMIGAAAWR